MSKRMTRTEARKLYDIRSSSQQNTDFNSWLLYYSIILDDGYSENSRNNYDRFVESSGSDYSSSSYDSSSYSSDSSSSSSFD